MSSSDFDGIDLFSESAADELCVFQPDCFAADESAEVSVI